MTNRVPRLLLMNPGPVNVSDRVRKALLGPDLCHREPEFSALLASIREKLLRVFGISRTHTAAFFTGSGTSAVEAMLSSFADRRKKILVLLNGVYGERMKKILELADTPVLTLVSPIGQFPDLAEIEALLKDDPFIHGVAMVHHETSSGMLNPLAPVGALCKKYKKTFLVDAVSSLGAEHVDFKKYDIGFAAGTSGKCLHGFPGVSFVIVSKEEEKKLEGKKPRSFYLDLRNALHHQKKNDTAFTPAVQVFYALHEALKELAAEGLGRRIANYAERSAVLEKGFIDLGLRFLVEKKYRSHVLTALWLPAPISYEKLHDRLKKDGFVIYAGQSALKDKIFRIANLGDMHRADLKRFLLSLGNILP